VPYRIVGWEDHYEVAQSRKVDGPLPWFRCPTDLNSRGYCRLMRHERGPAHYGVWIAVVALAARQPRSRRTGELSGDVQDIADQVRMPAKLVRESLDALIETGWVESETHSATTPLPVRSQSATTRVVGDETRRDVRPDERKKGAPSGAPCPTSKLAGPPASAPKASKHAATDAELRPTVDTVAAFYRRCFPSNRVTKATEAKVKARLRQGWKVEDLCKAIEGNLQSEWHQDPERKFNALGWIMHSCDRVETFKNKWRENGTLSGGALRSKGVVDRFVARAKTERRSIDDG